MTEDAAPEKIPTSDAPSVPTRELIGPVLRAARLKRGLSIESVSAQTRIPKRYLVALEEDRFDDFPAAVYLRGFLSGYCDHLDLPFEPLWASLAPAVPASAAPTASVAPQPASVPAPATPSSVPIAPTFTPLPASTHAASASSSAVGAILFALALAVAGTAWILHNRTPPPPPKPAQTMPQALLPVSKPVSTRVVVHALDDCWARVSVDGDVVFEGRIPRGAMMDWTPVKSMSLRTASAAALEVTKNDTPFELQSPSPDGDYRIDLP
ncbi:MAG: helix-turn-helix domain-containing protein [Elusimicrobia bacterium]|nr:helix-turn-helix domain-containing protein [Elusimicrobiota bacterium]